MYRAYAQCHHVMMCRDGRASACLNPECTCIMHAMNGVLCIVYAARKLLCGYPYHAMHVLRHDVQLLHKCIMHDHAHAMLS